MFSFVFQFLSRRLSMIFPRGLIGNTLRSQQTALLRVLAMSHRNGIDPYVTVMNLAVEQSGRYAGRLRDLVRWIAAKSSLSTALANTPGALDQDDTLAIQCGIETQQLDETFHYLIDDSRDRDDAETSPTFYGSLVYLFSASCITLLVLALMLGLILPTFVEIFREFDLELPSEMRLLISLANRFGWLLPLFLIALLAVAILLLFRNIRTALTRFPLVRDLPWNQLRRTAGLMRVFSVPCQTGNLVGPTVTAAAEHHWEDRCRSRLLNARNASTHDDDLWQQLAMQQLISTNTATQLQRITDPRLRSWALRALADQKREQASHQIKSVMGWLEIIPVLLLGLLIGWLVIAVMTTLSNLTLALS